MSNEDYVSILRGESGAQDVLAGMDMYERLEFEARNREVNAAINRAIAGDRQAENAWDKFIRFWNESKTELSETLTRQGDSLERILDVIGTNFVVGINMAERLQKMRLVLLRAGAPEWAVSEAANYLAPSWLAMADDEGEVPYRRYVDVANKITTRRQMRHQLTEDEYVDLASFVERRLVFERGRKDVQIWSTMDLLAELIGTSEKTMGEAVKKRLVKQQHKELLSLFTAFSGMTIQVLIDPDVDSKAHLAAKSLIQTAGQISGDGFARAFAAGCLKRTIDGQEVRVVGAVRSLFRNSIISGDDWYKWLGEATVDLLGRQLDATFFYAGDLQARIGGNQNYGARLDSLVTLLGEVNELEQERQIRFTLDRKFCQYFFDAYGLRLTGIKLKLDFNKKMVEVVALGGGEYEGEIEIFDDADEGFAIKRFEFVVDLGEKPNVFVNVVDEENVTTGFKGLLLLVVEQVLLHEQFFLRRAAAENATQPAVEEERARQRSAYVSRSKGPSQMAGSGRKRKHQTQLEIEEGDQVDRRFIAEVEQIRYRMELGFGTELNEKERQLKREDIYNEAGFDNVARQAADEFIALYNNGSGPEARVFVTTGEKYIGGKKYDRSIRIFFDKDSGVIVRAAYRRDVK